MSIILSHSYAQSVHSFFFFFIFRPPPRSTLFPYTTLFRSLDDSIRSARNGTRLDRHRFNPTAQRTGPTNAGVTREGRRLLLRRATRVDFPHVAQSPRRAARARRSRPRHERQHGVAALRHPLA